MTWQSHFDMNSIKRDSNSLNFRLQSMKRWRKCEPKFQGWRNEIKESKILNHSSQTYGNRSNYSFESSKVNRQVKLEVVDCRGLNARFILCSILERKSDCKKKNEKIIFWFVMWFVVICNIAIIVRWQIATERKTHFTKRKENLNIYTICCMAILNLCDIAHFDYSLFMIFW